MSRVLPPLLALGLFGCGGTVPARDPAPPPSIEVPVAVPEPSAATGALEDAGVSPSPPRDAKPTVAKGAWHIERSIEAGKWPEGVAIAGDVAWVADSGDRRVLRVSLAGKARPSFVPVGRLPVGIAVAPSDKIYSVAQTDKTVWEIDAKTSKGRVIATLPDCPTGFTVADGAVWTLLWKQCTSSSWSLARVDLATRAVTTSPEGRAAAWAVARAGERTFVAATETLAVVGGTDLRDVKTFEPSHQTSGARAIVAGPGAIYASADGVVLRVDVTRASVTRRTKLGERVVAMLADAQGVLAAGASGRLWELDPETLDVRQELAPPAEAAEPRALARWGKRLVLTDHGRDGEHGRVLVVALER